MKKKNDPFEKLSNQIIKTNRKIDDLKQKNDDAYRDILPSLEKILQEKIFQKYEWMENFSWVQYTPYFMDGDPCVFSANTSEVHIKTKSGNTWRSWDDWDNATDDNSIPPDVDMGVVHDEITEIIGFLSDDACLSLWGDHVSVIYDGKKFYTVDCSHD